MHFISVVTTIFVVLHGWCYKCNSFVRVVADRASRLFSSYKIVGISLARKVTIIQIHNNLRPRQKVPPIPLIFL